MEWEPVLFPMLFQHNLAAGNKEEKLVLSKPKLSTDHRLAHLQQHFNTLQLFQHTTRLQHRWQVEPLGKYKGRKLCVKLPWISAGIWSRCWKLN